MYLYYYIRCGHESSGLRKLAVKEMDFSNNFWFCSYEWLEKYLLTVHFLRWTTIFWWTRFSITIISLASEKIAAYQCLLQNPSLMQNDLIYNSFNFLLWLVSLMVFSLSLHLFLSLPFLTKNVWLLRQL